jgi:hypothetical protein
VVVGLGAPPLWHQLQDCYRFWKDEVKAHVAGNSKVFLDDFPGSYCYFASQWNTGAGDTPIVVLEKSH